MSRLALGTVQFGLNYGIANQTGQVSKADACLMLEYAASCGITVIDTAISYGESEACLGAIGVKGFKMITKLPSVPEGIEIADVRNWVHDQVTASLRRLGVATLYGLLLHRPGQLLGRFGGPLLAALLELKAQRLIDKLGVSIYAPEELETLDYIFQYELVQAPFNLFDRRLSTSGWLGRLNERGVEVHTRSVFLQGLLLMPISTIPSVFDKWTDLFIHWHQWLSQHDISPLQACLGFALSYSGINQVVVGADNVTHLNQIVAAGSRLVAFELPDLTCEDSNLIDPSRWKK